MDGVIDKSGFIQGVNAMGVSVSLFLVSWSYFNFNKASLYLLTYLYGFNKGNSSKFGGLMRFTEYWFD